MRILALIDVLSLEPAGGAGTVLLQTGRALVRRGHEVHVACRGRGDLPERGDLHGMHFTTYLAEPRRPWTLWKRGRALTRGALGDLRPEVLWSHHALPSVWIQDGVPAVPCVYTFHSPWHEEYLTRPGRRWWPFSSVAASLRRRWEHKALANSAAVTVLSRAMGDRLSAIHGPQAKLKVIPGGVDLERFRRAVDPREERKRFGVDAGSFLLVAVRSLIPRVGIDKLLEAFAQALPRIPEAHLLIGGGGPLRASLEAHAAALGIRDRVRFLGFVPDTQLAGLLGAADLVVMPSQELEGFGLVAVEALACGTPVVATPVGGLPEVLSDLNPSWLARDRTPSAIAEVILRQASEGTGPEVRGRCRQYAEQRFSWDRFATALEETLLEARGFPL